VGDDEDVVGPKSELDWGNPGDAPVHAANRGDGFLLGFCPAYDVRRLYLAGAEIANFLFIIPANTSADQLYVFASNNAGAAEGFLKTRGCFYCILGGVITTGQAVALSAAVLALQTALGRQ
jgi:hypothetical protein